MSHVARLLRQMATQFGLTVLLTNHRMSASAPVLYTPAASMKPTVQASFDATTNSRAESSPTSMSPFSAVTVLGESWQPVPDVRLLLQEPTNSTAHQDPCHASTKRIEICLCKDKNQSMYVPSRALPDKHRALSSSNHYAVVNARITQAGLVS